MFFSQSDIATTTGDICLIVTILSIYHFFYFQNKMVELDLDYEKMFLLASIIGLILHDLLTYKISVFINTTLNINNDNPISNTIYDIIKFGTLYICQQLITNMGSSDGMFSSLYNKNWQIGSMGVIIGYAIFNSIQKLLPTTIGSSIGPEIQRLYFDTIKVSIGFLFSQYLLNNQLTVNDLFKLGVLLLGWLIFHTFTIKLIVPVNKLATADLGITSYANYHTQ